MPEVGKTVKTDRKDFHEVEGEITDFSDFFEGISQAIDVKKQADKDLENRIRKLERSAARQPGALPHGFIEKIEVLISPIVLSEKDEDFHRNLRLYKVIATASAHGPETVPDSWIESVCIRATFRDRPFEDVDRMAGLFFNIVLQEVARQSPDRITPAIFDDVAAAAFDKTPGPRRGLAGIAYDTLGVLIKECDLAMLKPEYEAIIRADARRSATPAADKDYIGSLADSVVSMAASSAVRRIEGARRRASSAQKPGLS
ncbi:MAG: hypothetical protein PHE27_06450 [Alphaproteobacteria bacterium]|nr:hypothetical protein [Alphaproteobacteria bacterium]